MTIRIFNASCLEFLKAQTDKSYDCVFADPPDNLNLGYDAYDDKLPPREYYDWLFNVTREMCRVSRGVAWLSINSKHLPSVHKWLTPAGYNASRLFMWTYTFAQYSDTDCANAFRPILRFARKGWRPNVDLIREPSARMLLGDKRAAGPRVPSDVWSFPRVVGNAKERRAWHPTQHPEALMERILLVSEPDAPTLEKQGHYKVLDCFLGSGTTAIVSKRIGDIDCDGCEMSLNYCERAAEIIGCAVERFDANSPFQKRA